jgi:hypothetical protein
MHVLRIICNLVGLRRFGLPVFAGLCLLSAAAQASPVKETKACEEAVASPLKKVQIDGLQDTEFLARVTGELDAFWGELYGGGLSLEHLGLTAKNIEKFFPETRPPAPRREWRYKNVKVVVYEGPAPTGGGEHDDNPYYDRSNRSIYLSHRSLESKFDGRIRIDAGWAYIVAHEIAHHVQEQLGVFKIRSGRMEFKYQASFQRRVELQADCLAGFWVGKNRALFSAAEVAEIIELASRIGDATHNGHHGTGHQRADWLLKGMFSRSIRACDTFSADWGKI